ncbi:hypothetical protein ANME2D_01449 [Candidatus Methanoperedens nitroreducens]|uniref:Uncharacterized protein n=1 Tax=Candidatus Methanoperedens nitratireducens TaxID=1392998 RepID=A0A062V650_9EURY|nr:hypothetical protein [Candidatus Methanoperedens nitroreducens]KCZ72048.1 hypothetical protein ANME2D_01449 [Candidatus Methanoperedens nitroreducens]MDJ1421976.1 hypothetical protein [Candidatus Methanoperedens sp.]
MVKWVWLFAGLLVMGMAAAEEDMSSAQLAQLAVDMMGDSGQDAQISGFGIANSSQIGYSSDGNVTQTIFYDNIENGSVIQWGESGDMPREERTMFIDSVRDPGLTWQWNKGNVNQTINITNSENLYLRQIMGGLRKILFPDPDKEIGRDWWFCGKAVNGTGGLPLCAEKIAKRIFEGKATPRDYYMLHVLEEDYYVFPPENLTPRIILTKWSITRAGDNLTIKFRAHNFGKETYNATLMMDIIPKIDIEGFDGKTFRAEDAQNWEIKVPDKKVIEIGRYTVPSMKEIEGEVVVPLDGMKVKNMKMKMMSG